MENYPRMFVKASFVYLLLGVSLGVAIGVEPTWGDRLRFVHIHLNLLGFMAMMIVGVAYHVLPRFNARPIPWPEGVKYHFYLQNIGLVGMVATHLAGGLWKTGIIHYLFVSFALAAGAAIFIMCYNLYMVLIPPKPAELISAAITQDMKVGSVLSQFPRALPVFVQSGFTALVNPAARGTFAKLVSIDQACRKHGIDTGVFLKTLNAELFDKPGPAPEPPTATSEGGEKPAGLTIQMGEYCRPEMLVGSLIKTYPEVKAVFEKHYGEGCFSCPGQTFETVVQTARMHNVDTNLILGDINKAIESILKANNRL